MDSTELIKEALESYHNYEDGKFEKKSYLNGYYDARLKVSRVELPVKPACETLQKRFDIYARAINQIDDFFEYSYRNYSGEQTKEFIMDIIDNITEQLSKSV